MIAPHDEQELALMLAGQKPLAAFTDIIPPSGVIDEAIIPENQFRPYVAQKIIHRFSFDFSDSSGNAIRLVCFTLPNEEWRAHAYHFMRMNIHRKSIPYDHSVDVYCGLLLGYSQSDIQDFISQF